MVHRRRLRFLTTSRRRYLIASTACRGRQRWRLLRDCRSSNRNCGPRRFNARRRTPAPSNRRRRLANTHPSTPPIIPRISYTYVIIPITLIRILTTPIRILTTPIRILTTPIKIQTTPIRILTTPIRILTTPIKIQTTPIRILTTRRITIPLLQDNCLAIAINPPATPPCSRAIKSLCIRCRRTPIQW